MIPLMDEGFADGVLTVDLAALVANWRRLGAMGAPAACGAVVKADAYGLGQGPVMNALGAAGCQSFFVANLAEGELARRLAPDAVIYVLDGVAPGCAARLAQAALRPVLGAFEELDEWLAQARMSGVSLPAALHFDTGMNRLGFPRAAAPAVAARLAECAGLVHPALVISHFVSSQLADASINDRQIADFQVARGFFPGVPASMANSSGIFLPQRPYFDLLRPGYALYGGDPTLGPDNPMRPVVGLCVRILATREAAAGETAGYDATWTARRPSRLAIIGAGYADGVPVSASASAHKAAGEAVIGGVRCPFVGRVSMDYVILDVTDAPLQAAQRGGWAEILGDVIGVDDLARRAGVIGYEILTRLGRRYARRYIPSGAREPRLQHGVAGPGQ
jgi:alanine racemase